MTLLTGLTLMEKKMKAIIKTYPTNAEIFVDDANDNRHISVSYDFQDPNFFETKEEMRELIDEWLEEIKDVDNYEEIAQTLEIQLDRYRSEE